MPKVFSAVPPPVLPTMKCVVAPVLVIVPPLRFNVPVPPTVPMENQLLELSVPPLILNTPPPPLPSPLFTPTPTRISLAEVSAAVPLMFTVPTECAVAPDPVLSPILKPFVALLLSVPPVKLKTPVPPAVPTPR